MFVPRSFLSPGSSLAAAALLLLLALAPQASADLATVPVPLGPHGPSTGPFPETGLPQAAPAPQLLQDLWFNVSGSQRFPPPPLSGSSMAFDPVDNYLVLFGGCSATTCPAPAQTWKYTGGSWTDITNASTQPPARSFASFAFDSRDGYGLLFGGRGANGVALNDTWSFIGGIWTNLTNVSLAPPARYGAPMDYDHTDSAATIFGGCGPAQCPMNDTWRFSSGVWRNASVTAGAPPAARVGASFAWDFGDSMGVLFGGLGSTAPLNDTWSFFHGKWIALTPALSPPARSFATMTYFVVDNATYLFGGNGTAGVHSDTWRFSSLRWTNISALASTPPSARLGMAAPESTIAWTVSGAKKWLYVFAFGGEGANCTLCAADSRGDTWVFEPALTVSPSALPTTVEVGQPVTFSATAAGGSAPFLFLWQFGDLSSAFGAALVHTYTLPMVYNAQITATDSAGASARGIVTVTVVPGPVVTLTAQPRETDVGRPVSLQSTATGGTPPLAYRWSFGDLTTGSGANATHAYAVAGNFSVNLTVTDGVQGFGVAGAWVLINAMPDLSVTASTLAAHPGTNISFGSSVLGGTAPFTTSWTFGDGNGSTGTNVVHNYSRVGTYLVASTLVDAVGMVSWENLTVVVSPVVVLPPPSNNSTGLTTLQWLGIAALGVGALFALVGALIILARHRQRPPPSLAAAPVGQGEWSPDADDNPAHSRSGRRSIQRFYRRRG